MRWLYLSKIHASYLIIHSGKLVGEDCDGNLNKCLSPFALCRDGVCRCNMLMEPTTDGLCRAPFEAEIHQSCEEKFCVSSTVCVNDVCECPDDMREITSDEYWFDPCKARRCVNANHSLGKCSSYYIQCTVNKIEKKPNHLLADFCLYIIRNQGIF